jgi:hypothetical protein
MLICFLLFMGIHSKTRKIITHNRQVPCSSQGGATIFLLQIIKLHHTRRLIDFGSHLNPSEKPLLANVVLSQPLRGFDLCPSRHNRPANVCCRLQLWGSGAGHFFSKSFNSVGTPELTGQQQAPVA